MLCLFIVLHGALFKPVLALKQQVLLSGNYLPPAACSHVTACLMMPFRIRCQDEGSALCRCGTEAPHMDSVAENQAANLLAAMLRQACAMLPQDCRLGEQAQHQARHCLWLSLQLAACCHDARDRVLHGPPSQQMGEACCSARRLPLQPRDPTLRPDRVSMKCSL